MRNTTGVGLAALLFALAGPAMAGGGSGDDEPASGVAMISGDWAHQYSTCDGDPSTLMSISADGDTLLVRLGEASADEAIESDRGGIVRTHSEQGRFSYQIVDGALTIADLDADLVERLLPCGADQEDMTAADVDRDVDSDVDDDPDEDTDPDANPDKG